MKLDAQQALHNICRLRGGVENVKIVGFVSRMAYQGQGEMGKELTIRDQIFPPHGGHRHVDYRRLGPRAGSQPAKTWKVLGAGEDLVPAEAAHKRFTAARHFARIGTEGAGAEVERGREVGIETQRAHGAAHEAPETHHCADALLRHTAG